MKAKYDLIGSNYNNTRKADPFILQNLLQHIHPNKSGKYLDIGCGTGNYTIALYQKGYNFIGVDPSDVMLKKAFENDENVDWKLGKAEDVPFENDLFDGVLAMLTIHHWKDLKEGFSEISRVLKPNCRFVIFTSTSEQMYGYWLNHYFPKMLKDSSEQMPKYLKIEEDLNDNGLKIVGTEKYFVRNDLEDLFLYSGKHKPELYLEKQFRNGISSFTDLANSTEVESGLSELERDISSGKIKEIIAEYENNEGDYLFIVSKKLTEA